MSGVVPFLKGLGPATYPVAALIKGGQLVVPDGTDSTKVNVAGANAANVVGVAANDSEPLPDQSSSTTSYGQPVFDISVPPGYVAVHYGGVVIPVTYNTNAAFGQKLAADAGGKVKAYGVAAAGAVGTFDQIVGICRQPGGVIAGSVGLAEIF